MGSEILTQMRKVLNKERKPTECKYYYKMIVKFKRRNRSKKIIKLLFTENSLSRVIYRTERNREDLKSKNFISKLFSIFKREENDGIALLEIVKNKEKHMLANSTYCQISFEGKDGKDYFLLFTYREILVALKRAAKNREDFEKEKRVLERAFK